jgi:hypothetical protein
MCGIFGFVAKKQSGVSPKDFQHTFRTLMRLSESRGKEASGIAIRTENAIKILKKPVAATQLLKNIGFKNILNEATYCRAYTLALGHSRLVTDGAQSFHYNNQPVIKCGLVGIHNGIITNHQKLWDILPNMGKEFDIDTEALLALTKHFQNLNNSLPDGLKRAFAGIEGSASVAILSVTNDRLTLATNTGSLYFYHNAGRGLFIFASEKNILKQLVKNKVCHFIAQDNIVQLKSGEGLVIDPEHGSIHPFSLKASDDLLPPPAIALKEKTPIIDVSGQETLKNISRCIPAEAAKIPADIIRHNQECQERVKHLRRCARCVLPVTTPLIDFDEHGVCRYCRSYQHIETLGPAALESITTPLKTNDGSPDCIVSLSGGRDSCYTLHYVKNVLKMNPIAYSYDWGMITDLGRRNQARLCGKLGVEHIIVSADIQQKRKYIQQNILAWLKRPELGILPLFMAGDKQYFYFANQLKKQTGVKLLLMGENLLERSKFKTGFCNLLETKKYSYTLSFRQTLNLSFYYAKQYMLNPAYLNSSLFDTLWAFESFYFEPHEYINFYNYIPWDENSIVKTLCNDYNWELAQDTQSTWRIGDGTAAFYNYIYYTVAGFTEHDTFRSNEIREGLKTRQEALALVETENQPRFESIRWYCDTIGIDILKTLRTINQIPKRFSF